MKQKSILAFILLFSILITGCSSKNKSTEETINDSNIYNKAVFQKLDDISLKVPFFSVGAHLCPYYNSANITEENFPFHKGEQLNEKGNLLNNKMYVEIQNCIRNDTDKTVKINLEEFYLVKQGEDEEIERGSTNLRYAYLKDKDSKAVLDNFFLHLRPFTQTDVMTIYIEDLANVLDTTGTLNSSCFYRVKRNDEVAYYNISTSSSPNPDY